ncbi:MAG: ubiquinone/menaquinone biosynthesis methyltransferase, partial [Candidatus Dormibacteria bacterium]
MTETMKPPTPLPDSSEKARDVEAMFDRIADRYDVLNRVLTLGLDVRWRRRTVRALDLARGGLVVDLACGTGDLCDELQRSGFRAIGVDIAARMLARAHTRAPLMRADILRLPLRDGSVDGVTCGFALRNVTDIGRCFAESARVLRAGGRVGFLEVAQPQSRVLRFGHALYFDHVVPFIGGLLSDRQAYRYLPASAVYLPDGPTLIQM